MDTIKEKERVEKLNSDLIDQLFEALSLKTESSEMHTSSKRTSIRFTLTREVAEKRFLRKDKIKEVDVNYYLIIRNKLPYFKFRLWGRSIFDIEGEDVREDATIKLKWIMYAIDSYIQEQKEKLEEITSQTTIIETLLEKVNISV